MKIPKTYGYPYDEGLSGGTFSIALIQLRIWVTRHLLVVWDSPMGSLDQAPQRGFHHLTWIMLLVEAPLSTRTSQKSQEMIPSSCPDQRCNAEVSCTENDEAASCHRAE